MFSFLVFCCILTTAIIQIDHHLNTKAITRVNAGQKTIVFLLSEWALNRQKSFFGIWNETPKWCIKYNHSKALAIVTGVIATSWKMKESLLLLKRKHWVRRGPLAFFRKKGRAYSADKHNSFVPTFGRVWTSLWLLGTTVQIRELIRPVCVYKLHFNSTYILISNYNIKINCNSSDSLHLNPSQNGKSHCNLNLNTIKCQTNQSQRFPTRFPHSTTNGGTSKIPYLPKISRRHTIVFNDTHKCPFRPGNIYSTK